MTCRTIYHQITEIPNDLVPKTARNPEKARDFDPQRERGKGRRALSKTKTEEVERADGGPQSK